MTITDWIIMAVTIAGWELGGWLYRKIKAWQNPPVEWKCTHCTTSLKVSAETRKDRERVESLMNEIAVSHLDGHDEAAP